MKKSWTQGLDERGTKEMVQEFNSSALLRERLTELLQSHQMEKLKSGRSADGYQSPNWSHKQADLNGYLRGIDHALSLIESKATKPE